MHKEKPRSKCFKSNEYSGIFTVGLLVIFLHIFSYILQLTEYVYYFILKNSCCMQQEFNVKGIKLNKNSDTKDSIFHDSIHITF